MNIDLAKTILEFKQEVEKHTKLQTADQILVYCGGELFDEGTAASYHISQGAQIFLLDKKDKNPESRVEWLKGRDL